MTFNGAEALNNSVLSFTGPGDEVIVPTPAFLSYKALVNFAGADFVDVPLKAEDGFQLNAEEIEKAVTPRTKMIIINNPNDPSGAVYTRQTLEKVAALAVKHDLLALSDEMYSRLVYDGTEFIAIASLPGMKERTIVVAGFSKTYAMTGWRLGYMAADKKLCDWLIKCHSTPPPPLPHSSSRDWWTLWRTPRPSARSRICWILLPDAVGSSWMDCGGSLG